MLWIACHSKRKTLGVEAVIAEFRVASARVDDLKRHTASP